MILTTHYFQKPHTPEQEKSAQDLLASVNALCHEAQALGVFDFGNDPDTGSPISGSQGGDGDGGFRTPGSRTGASHSPHRRALAVDIFDPGDKLDKWLTDEKLTAYNLYREDPDWTPGWVHIQSIPPASGKRTFQP
jgi:hypothetical protein